MRNGDFNSSAAANFGVILGLTPSMTPHSAATLEPHISHKLLPPTHKLMFWTCCCVAFKMAFKMGS